jgi:hypothetical protein
MAISEVVNNPKVADRLSSGAVVDQLVKIVQVGTSRPRCRWPVRLHAGLSAAAHRDVIFDGYKAKGVVPTVRATEGLRCACRGR